MPITASVLYPRTATSKFNMDYYLNSHMPLVYETWSKHGLLSWEVLSFSKDLGGSDSAHSVQALLRWESEEDARKAVDTSSPAAQKVFGDVPNFSNEGPTFYWGKSEGQSK